VNALSKEINEINRNNGWKVVTKEDWGDSEYKIPAIIALITSEASEALEAFRKNDYENFKEELADVIIRTLDCCGGLDIDIEEEIMKKMEKNRQRSYRHGGKRV
jgi:NTP pyrophosphatase (non-canonical NTP hydrolase)